MTTTAVARHLYDPGLEYWRGLINHGMKADLGDFSSPAKMVGLLGSAGHIPAIPASMKTRNGEWTFMKRELYVPPSFVSPGESKPQPGVFAFYEVNRAVSYVFASRPGAGEALSLDEVVHNADVLTWGLLERCYAFYALTRSPTRYLTVSGVTNISFPEKVISGKAFSQLQNPAGYLYGDQALGAILDERNNRLLVQCAESSYALYQTAGGKLPREEFSATFEEIHSGKVKRELLGKLVKLPDLARIVNAVLEAEEKAEEKRKKSEK